MGGENGTGMAMLVRRVGIIIKKWEYMRVPSAGSMGARRSPRVTYDGKGHGFALLVWKLDVRDE